MLHLQWLSDGGSVQDDAIASAIVASVHLHI